VRRDTAFQQAPVKATASVEKKNDGGIAVRPWVSTDAH
jgi:hypothetical protein